MPTRVKRLHATEAAARVGYAVAMLGRRGSGCADLLGPTDRKSATYHALPLKTRFDLSWVANEAGCWIWCAGMKPNGYGVMEHHGVMWQAHRAAYDLLVGPIPVGLDLDHRCHTDDPACPGGWTCPHRRCVNPAHLEPVTRKENLRRALAARTHCKSGRHERTPENTFTKPSGRKTCLPCMRDVHKRAAAKKFAIVAEAVAA